MFIPVSISQKICVCVCVCASYIANKNTDKVDFKLKYTIFVAANFNRFYSGMLIQEI